MATYLKCTHCQKEEYISDGISLYFQKDKQKKYGFRMQCKECRSFISREWRSKNENMINIKNASRKMFSRYGITIDDYDNMLTEQNGVCAICGTSKLSKNKSRFAIDHCHNTGAIRGLLCSNCNSGIGKLKDNPDIIIKAYEYLIKNGGLN